MSSSDRVTGACNCGAISISVTKSVFDASPSVICSCLGCRASCGSLFSVNVPVPLKEVKVEKGKPNVYQDTGDSGKPVHRNFCGDCGSPVFSVLDVAPETAFVKGGLFKQFGVDLPEPGVQLYRKRAEKWEREQVEGVQCTDAGH